MWFSLKDIREMSDQEIKRKYYAMINQSRHEFNEKQKLNLLHHQLDDFRAKLEKARREIPAYPFTGTSSYYPYEKFDSHPFDEYS